MKAVRDYKNRTLTLTECSAQEARTVLAGLIDEPELLAVLHQIKTNTETIMATQAEVNARIDTINANTSRTAAAVIAVKAILVALREKIATGGMTADEEAALLVRLDAAIGTTGEVATNLEQTAAGEVEPTPVDPPVVVDPGTGGGPE